MRDFAHNQARTTPDAHNRGAARAFIHATTDRIPRDDRLEYWRSLFVASRIERPPSCDDGSFNGEMLSSIACEGVFFSTLRGDPVSCHFGERDGGIMLLGWINSGALHIGHGRDERLSVDTSSGLLLADCDRRFATHSEHYGLTYLALPRSLVTDASGGNPVPRDGAVRMLQDNPMVASCQRVLQGISNHAGRWNIVQTTEALHTARALAVALLASTFGSWRRLPESFDDALFRAACHQLSLYAGDPYLTAGRVAAMLGCSRAHLYRLFATRERTVAGELRTLRMQHAHRLLESDPALTIGAIAWQCGYTEHSAFDKAFRRAFGQTPADCRQRAMSRTTA